MLIIAAKVQKKWERGIWNQKRGVFDAVVFANYQTKNRNGKNSIPVFV